MTEVRTQERLVSVPGGDLYVKTWRPQPCRYQIPLVLLHESLGSAEQWRDFPAQLSIRLCRPVIAYDRLGFGRSSARDLPPSMNFINEEADTYFPRLKMALALHQYILFGHSVGGPMAIAIAAHDSACVAVITEAAQAAVEAQTVSGIQAAMQAFLQPGQMDRLKKWHGHKADWVLHAWADVWCAAAFASWSLAPYVGKVHCPLLAIHGDQDEYGSLAFPKMISSQIGSHGRMLILKDCGHVPHRAQPQTVMDAVAGFLNSVAIE